MGLEIVHFGLLVRDYDEAINFFTRVLGFELLEDTFQPEQNKRWVVVAPRGSTGMTITLARPSAPGQEQFIGNQNGGRVLLSLGTDDFWRDYADLVSKGVRFTRPPREDSYGTVAVFEDVYGNLWDLIQYRPDHYMSKRR